MTRAEATPVLYGRQTELAVANFPISGRPMPIGVVRALAAIKREAAEVNATLPGSGVDAAVGAAVAAAAAEVEAGRHDAQFPIDVFQTGSGTSTNMNVNEVVARLASDASGLAVHPNDHVNAGQSSNDTFPSAVAVAALVALRRDLVPAVAQLRESLAGAGRRFAGVVKAGRTHLMDAVPITLGAEFDGYAAQLDEALERFTSAEARVGRLPLGGTAVGTGLNAAPGLADAVVARLAARLDLPLSIAPDRVAAQSARDALVELSSHLRGLAVAQTKIANDIRLMGSGPSTGFAELRLPELQAGSSIMPGKVNPVMPEMLTQVAAQVIGNDAAVAFAGSQGAFELNTYQPVMAANVLWSIELLANASRTFATRCVDGLEADVERCRTNAESSPAIATALNATLGYDRVAALVKQAVAQRRSIVDVVVEAGDLDEATVRRLVDVVALARGESASPGAG